MTQSALILQRQNRVVAGFYNNNPTARVGDAQFVTQINAGNNPVCIGIANRQTLITLPCRCPEIIPPVPPVPPEPITICSTGSLNTIATYLRNYMTEFRNPNFWAYTCDGAFANFIYDGGQDMFDSGNFVTPWLLSGALYNTGANDIFFYPYRITYSTVTETTVDTDFNYISLGWIEQEDTGEQQIDQSRHPVTVMGYRCSGPVGWQMGGNTGADGSGTVISGYVYNNTIVNDFRVYAGYRQIYDASGDPAICSLVILLGHPFWNSVFDTVTLASDDSDTDICGFYMYTGAGSENVLGIYTLLSKTPDTNTTPISNSELQTVIQNFIQRIKEAMNL
jgi:hypothetical protein